MLSLVRNIGAAVLLAVMASATVAQQDLPTFPSFSADDPQRIGFISRLNPERRAALAGFLDEADVHGFFPADVEARDGAEYGIILYLLSEWGDVHQLPPHVLPPVVLPQLEAVEPTYYRFAVPARAGSGKTFVMLFYVMADNGDATLRCLSEDLVAAVAARFASAAKADCVK